MNIEYRRESGQTRTGFDNIIYMTPEESGDTEIVPNSNPQPQVEPAVLASASRIERFFQKAAKSKLGRAAAFIALLGGGAIGAHEGQANVTKAFAANGHNRIETTQNSEGLTTQEIFANLQATDPYNSYVAVMDSNNYVDSSVKVTRITMLANQSYLQEYANKWRVFSSERQQNNAFSEFKPISGYLSGDPTLTYTSGSKTFVVVENGVSVTGSGLYIMDYSLGKTDLIALDAQGIGSKAVVTQTESLFLQKNDGLIGMDMRTNTPYTIPVSLESGATLGSIQKVSSSNTEALFIAKVYSPTPKGIVKLRVNVANNTLIEQSRDYITKRSDLVYGTKDEDYLYDRNTNQLSIMDSTTKQLKKSYVLPESISALMVDDKNIVTIARTPTWSSLKVWRKDIDPISNSGEVSSRIILEGWKDPQQTSNPIKETIEEGDIDGSLFYFMDMSGEGKVAIKANPNGSVNSDAERYLIVEGIIKSYEESTPTPTITPTKTPTPTATAVVSSTATFTPSPSNTPTPTRTATSSPTPIITPSATSTATGNNFKVFLPVTTRKKTSN